MCDYGDRLRGSNASTSVVSVGTTPTLLVPGNVNRLALILSAPSVASVSVSTKMGVTAGEGLVLYANTPAVWIAFEGFGGFVTQPLYAVSSSGTVTVGTVEITG